MLTRWTSYFATCIVLIFVIGAAGCTDKDRIVELATLPTNPEVFIDGFAAGVTYQAFAGSKLDAVQIDASDQYQGSQSLIVTVPDVGDMSGSFAGGAFTTGTARNLSQFNALTFWAKASVSATLNVAGIGNDNTGNSRFTAEVNDLPLTTNWTKYVIPIPLSEKLTAERGLFYFAEGPEGSSGYQLWFDEIKFENLGTIAFPQPSIPNTTIEVEVDDTVKIGNGTVVFDINGSPQTVSAMPGYFTFTSSNEAVVRVDSIGNVIAMGLGTATIGAKLGSVNATGTITINVNAAQAEPTVPAPAPTADAADVISLFSDAYSNVTVDTWSADWDFADVSDYTIGSDSVKKYEIQDYAGVEFTNPTLNVSSMTRFHMDIWTPNSTALPAQFKIKLVDYGANGVSDYPAQGDDVEGELAFDRNTAPALATGTWVSIDLPMAAFSDLKTRGHLAQLIISGDLGIVYVDNIYFYDAGQQTAPLIPAPTPSQDPGDVISLFSDVYTNVPIDTWSAVWDFADVADYQIGSDHVKKYTNLTSAGVEFRSNTIDASAMTHFHMNVWTPDATSSPSVFKIKLVDFGADGSYGGGDDVEHEIVLNQNTMKTGIWVNINLSLADFTGLTTKEHLGQLILSGTPNTVFVDNVYFYDSGIPIAPPVPAPTPTINADSVISLFSDAYTDVPVDTWSAVWDTADVQNYAIGSDTTKKYTNLLFAGIEFTSNTIDASAMNYFHMDVWTPDPTDAPAVFKIKLVDFGGDGAYQGGDDVEQEITLDDNTMNTGSWVSIELPLSMFTDLTTRGHLAQMVISGDPNTIYVDNVYFHQ